MKYGLIMAGGHSTRLHPICTEQNPKQFSSLINDESLLKNTYDRTKKMIKEENIFIVLPQKYKEQARNILPNINDENIIIEPSNNGTSLCILYSCLYILKIRQKGTLYVFPSDHYIEDDMLFLSTMEKGYNYIINNHSIILFGIKPTYPSIHYGYLENKDSNEISEVISFKEKPNYEVASVYLKNKNYYWNSGIYLFDIEYLLKKYQFLQLDKYNLVKDIVYEKSDESNYNVFSSEPFEKAILEKSNDIVSIKCNFVWDDIGTFERLKLYCNKKTLDEIIKLENKQNQ